MDAKAYAARNRQGSDWFTHGSEKKVEIQPVPQKSDVPTESVDRTQLIRPVCQSNEWYKYDEKSTSSAPANHHDSSKDVAAGMASKANAGWQPGASSPACDPNKDSKKDAEAYGKRDKAGSDWFSHGGDQQQSGHVTPRCATTEGTNNANRMRQQSEDWFGQSATTGTNQANRIKSGNRANSSAMHDIFHMNGDK